MLDKMRSSAAWLAGRSLLPSTVSLAACLMLGLALSLVHLLITCVRQGAILPNFLDGQWALAYGTMIEQPLSSFLGEASFNNVAIVILWGLAGLFVYTIVEHAWKNYREWRAAEDAIQLIDPGHVIRHPLQNDFFAALVWRVALTCMFIVWAIIALRLLQKLAASNTSPFFGIPRATFMWHMVLMALGWALLLHVLVILLRFAAHRSRLFGGRHESGNEEISFFRS